MRSICELGRCPHKKPIIRQILSQSLVRLAVVSFLGFFFSQQAIPQQQAWKAQGPGPNTLGQVEHIDGGEVIGAIKVVTPHPTNENIIYVGAVNGGIWKTINAAQKNPNWEQRTDGSASLSIGALSFDPTDATNQTLVAGVGRFSSLARYGGRRTGLLRTSTGGATWSSLANTEELVGLNISGVAPRGNTIIVAVNDSDDCENTGKCDALGIWQCTLGSQCKQLSGDQTSGLPAGASSSLAADPKDPAILYTNAGGTGLYRSANTGVLWTKVSTVEMDALITQADNFKISVGNSKNVYVAIDVQYDGDNQLGRLAGVFFSPNGGSSWKQMDLPTTPEGGIHPGGQGGIHLSIAADSRSPNIVYIGGDAQPEPFPNSIGAQSYSGRLFRGDSSAKPGKQWVHLTHSNKAGPSGGGTASGSAPHADSRGLALAANGDLIEVDDGGIYRRTKPQTNIGDWFSLNGDLQVTEFHSVAWDSNCHLVIGGAQDTGTPEQRSRSAVLWESVSQSDGGVVAVDVTSAPGQSIRYSSAYNFLNFVRQTYNGANVFQNRTYPPLTVVGGGAPLNPQFYTPIKLNTVAATRLIIGGKNSVYESLDQGDSIQEIGAGIVVNGNGPNPIAYGAKDNPDILYVGARNQVYVRTHASPAHLELSRNYTGDVLGVTLNPEHGDIAFLVTPTQVFETTNAGNAWTPITGNLTALSRATLRSIAYADTSSEGTLLVGADTGVYASHGPSFSTWSPLGSALPNAPVYHLEYSQSDGILLAGTFGRGAWTLTLPSPVRASRDRVTTSSAPTLREPQSPEHLDETQLLAASYRLPAITSQQAPKEDTFELAPGVIVDVSRSRLYAMNPDGGIQAVDVASGQTIWSNKLAAKPIGFAEGRVIAQVETPPRDRKLIVRALDPLTGKELVTGGSDLPPDVLPSIGRTLKGDFEAFVTATDGSAVVSWDFKEPIQRTIPPGTRSELHPSQGVRPLTVPPKKVTSGGFRMDLGTGKTSQIDLKNLKELAPRFTELELQTEQLDNNQETAFLSVDRKFGLISERTGSSADIDQYTLTIVDRKTSTRLGKFKSHTSSVRFIVMGSRVVYESTPYSQRQGDRISEQPPRINGLELATGQQVWSLILRDTAYRGPFPP